MAGLPPRSRSRSLSASVTNRSPLETLKHMGFSRERAEKAIAATGNHGIQQAAEWLLSHANDPQLDSQEPREYIIYLCPSGELRRNLLDFLDISKQNFGWNSAHIYFPHVTLCPFFKFSRSIQDEVACYSLLSLPSLYQVPNNQVNVIDLVMEVVSREIGLWPSVGPLGLDLFTQNKNFIGYFVKNPHHQFVEQLMIKVMEVFVKHGIDMKPQMKQIHMTLAFQYDPEHHDGLMKLAQEMIRPCDASWEIQIYSRLQDLKTAEVRRVIQSYQPVQTDELTLADSDFVYIAPEEHEHSPDGWFKGTSHQTGISAFFPKNFTVKCSQMEMWTLHRSVPILSLTSQSFPTNGTCTPETNPISLNNEAEYSNVWMAGLPKEDELYAKVNKQRHNSSLLPRKLHIIRHAERCDFAFFRTWFDKSFDHEGRYIRFNLNCPKTMVPRKPFSDFKKDSPLTVIGREQARITGEALLESGESVSYIYCSPALRCVETATEIIKGGSCTIALSVVSLSTSTCLLTDRRSEMLIEPSLFEWSGWYKPSLPTFMTPDELKNCGFPVDTTYAAYIVAENINVYESVEDYYTRSYNFTQHVLHKHKATGGNILLIGHSGTLDACTRQLTGKLGRSADEFRNIVRGCPYCCLCTAVEDSTPGRWTLVEPPIPQLTHGANSKDYTWNSLQS